MSVKRKPKTAIKQRTKKDASGTKTSSDVPQVDLLTSALVTAMEWKRLFARHKRGGQVPREELLEMVSRSDEVIGLGEELLKKQKKIVELPAGKKEVAFLPPDLLKHILNTNDEMVSEAIKTARQMASSGDSEKVGSGGGFLVLAGDLYRMMEYGSKEDAREAAIHLGILAFFMQIAEDRESYHGFARLRISQIRGRHKTKIFDTQDKIDKLREVYDQFKGQDKALFKVSKKLRELGIEGRKSGRPPSQRTIKRAIKELLAGSS